MERIKAVSDTGPVFHLFEINSVSLLHLFSPISIPPEVRDELKRHAVSLPSFIKTKSLDKKTKDFAQLLMLQFELELGEAEAIGLFRQEKAFLFFTDDLDAREAAKTLGIDVHGTIGILLRSFRKGKLSKKETIEKLHSLKETSLFVTSELIKQAVEGIEHYV